jgi:hypothetical protein
MFERQHTQENPYWINFNSTVSFGLHCYAVRSDMFAELLAIRYSTNVDCVAFRNAYGAAYPETLLELPKDAYFSWRNFLNTYINTHEPYHGFVACYEHVSEAR